jgi:hypothetical protein
MTKSKSGQKHGRINNRDLQASPPTGNAIGNTCRSIANIKRQILPLEQPQSAGSA